jgi:hypothetical protein
MDFGATREKITKKFLDISKEKKILDLQRMTLFFQTWKL